MSAHSAAAQAARAAQAAQAAFWMQNAVIGLPGGAFCIQNAVIGLGLEQLEAGALVVGAGGDSAVGLLLGLAGLAAVLADCSQRGRQVVDLVDRLDPGPVRAAVHPGRRVGA
ncbi:MAG: hypothetical protein ACRDTZ_17305, partial [Pseudonocardiaceae bacterium]